MTVPSVTELSDFFDDVESRFSIQVPTEHREILDTPRAVVEYLCSRLPETPSSACLSQQAFYRLRSTLIRDFAVPKGTITPSAQLDSLLPQKGRVRAWEDLRRGVDAVHWPELRRGDNHERFVYYGGVAVGCVIFFGGLPVGLNPALGLVAGFGGAYLAGMALARLTDNRRTALPWGYSDIAALVRVVVADNTLRSPTVWTREVVTAHVAEILASRYNARDWYPDASLRRDFEFD